MFKERVPSDVVKAVFHYLGAGERFPAKIPKIHEAFFRLCQREEFSGLCSEFVFDTSKIFPYSPTIRYALDRLQKADLLACRNPALDEYEVSKALANAEADVVELFPSERERTLLKEAATLFRKYVSAA